jgi:hypothetical protein
MTKLTWKQQQIKEQQQWGRLCAIYAQAGRFVDYEHWMLSIKTSNTARFAKAHVSGSLDALLEILEKHESSI